jgi:hypothetical protein
MMAGLFVEGATGMPKYEENKQELIFPAAESSEGCCPVCNGHELDYGASETHDDCIIYPWGCPSCGSEGKEYGAITFDGHNVDFTTVPADMQVAYTGMRTMCVNGILKAGDLALAVSDSLGFPCLPGRVTAIDTLGSKKHTSGNSTDDVHMDFTGDYGERRVREIVEEDARLRGYAVPFDEIRLDDILMPPSRLIVINDIGDDELRRIMDSEENALRYACKSLRMLL